MTARLYPSGHLSHVSPIESCGAEGCNWQGPLRGLPHCNECGKHHAPGYKGKGHENLCRTVGCSNQALRQDFRGAITRDGKKPFAMCRACYLKRHELGDDADPYAIEAANLRDLAETEHLRLSRLKRAKEASKPLAEAMNLPAEKPYPTPRTGEAAFYEPESDKSETVHRVDWLAGHAWCTCLGFLRNRRCKHADAEEEKHRSE